MSEKLSVVREQAEAGVKAAKEALARAEEAERRAREEVERARAEVARAERAGQLKVRLARLEAEAEQVRAAIRELAPAGNSNAAGGAGTVTAEDGEVRELSKEAVATVKRLVGRRRKGIFSPLESDEAVALLTALDEKGVVGDRVVVKLAGWKGELRLWVEAEGLRFERSK